MKARKTLLPIAVAAIFIALAFTPSVSAETSEEDPIEPVNRDLVLEIGYKDLNGYTFYKKITVSEEQLGQFTTSWDEWEALVEDIREDGFMDVQETLDFQDSVVDLVEEIRDMTHDPDSGQYAFPETLIPTVGIAGFIQDFLFMKGLGRKLFSIGRGRAWLPSNRQGEQFIGMRFLPIIIQHSPGFSKVRRINLIPPSIGVEDRLFTHNILTMGFVGLYINFGERYLDRPAGPVVLIGRTCFVRLGEDIP